MASPLIQFYLGEDPDTEGRFLRDIHGWDARRLEGVHDYIQWLFPTRQRSRFNPDAPLLGPEEIQAFRANERLRTALRESLRQMLAFYGFTYREDGDAPVIETAPDWPTRSASWFHPGNHNLLRVTRILDCLSTLGCSKEAQAFLATLETVCQRQTGAVPPRTLDFWRKAVADDENWF